MIKEKTINPLTVIPDEIVATCEFDVKSGLALAIAPGMLILRNKKMMAMNLVKAITTFSEFGADLTAKLAKACGFCDNCGEIGTGTPASWAAECDLCAELLAIKNDIRVPEYLRDKAGITPNAKLTAKTDEESGEIILSEAGYDYDISDVPPELLEVLRLSGVCLGALDEALRLERVIDVG
ncbi:MAG: hypothetical protein VB064_09035 [Oscillospiraceae bacterium]|nr:hypothetical protein [Oscillospiraceae bacterium]